VDSLKPGRYAVELQKFTMREVGAPHVPAGTRAALGEVEIRPGELARFEASAR